MTRPKNEPKSRAPTPAERLASVLQAAIRCHQQGDLVKAAALYRELLLGDPKHPDALHLLGVIAYQRGRHSDAVELMARAIAANPLQANYHYNLGVTLQELRRLDRALASYEQAVQLDPNHADAFNNRGNVLKELGRLDLALASYDRAVRLKPDFADAFNNRGIALKELGRLDQALASHERALRLRPDYPEALNSRGNVLKELKRLDEALASYDRAIRLRPTYADAFNNRGNALHEGKRLDEALASYEEAIRLRPTYADAFNNRGNVLKELGRLDEALASYDEAIRLKPDDAEALSNRGNVLKGLGRLGEALASYDEAIRLRPDFADALSNRGNALYELRRLEPALASYDEAIRLRPDLADAFNNRGNVLRELRRLEPALASYDEALRLRPDHAVAFNNRGIALQELNRPEEARASYDEAIRLGPDQADAFYNRGTALKELRRLEEALASFDEAVRRKPDYAAAQVMAAHLSGALCRWDGLDGRLAAVASCVSERQGVAPSFPLLALIDDPQLHRRAAARWVEARVPYSGALGALPRRARGRKIHVAYLSADFHDHATSYLMAQLFESHDRDRFELTAISFGPDTGDAMRARVSAAFDRFEDVRGRGDLAVAQRCRQIAVDIAVDLKGFTQDSRPGILAERCAPMQLSWLGYPGTMGAPFIDYIVADPTLIRDADLPHYTEQVLWLPDSYQVNDGKRPIAERAFTRAECGLPETGFVFCCFNNSYKILPATFEVWTRILARAPGSVLWLLEDNAAAARNLRAEAAARGVDPGRLVFAQRMPLPEHLARHRVADLFLDTWPYNAHTTASDALWTGLPLLTRAGRSFASRVAASLLQAIGLPELITHADGDYEELAVAVARDPGRAAALKQKLAANRLSHPLFDCERFTRHLEAGYQQVMERHWSGAEPAHLAVAPAHQGGSSGDDAGGEPELAAVAAPGLA